METCHPYTYSSPSSASPKLHALGGNIFNLRKKGSLVFLFIIILLLYEVSYYMSLQNFLRPELVQQLAIISQNESKSRILFSYLERISYWGYLIIPITILLKITALTFFVKLPFLLNYTIVSFKRIFTILLWGGLVSASGECIRVLKMYFSAPHLGNLANFQFTPFGFVDFLNTEAYTSAFLVLLNYFNLFELGWFIVVFVGLSRIPKVRKSDAYLVVLLVWISVVMIQWGFAYYLSEIDVLPI